MSENKSQFREVQVQDGDTLYSIAQRELGDPNRWPELVPHNQEILAKHTYVPANSRLIVPVDQPDPQPSGL
jgi:hypothetical protein